MVWLENTYSLQKNCTDKKFSGGRKIHENGKNEMTIWIGTKPKRTKFYLMIGLVLVLLLVGCVLVFASPQIPSIPIEYGEPVPVVIP